MSHMFTYGLFDLLLQEVGLLVAVDIVRIYIKSSHTRQFLA